MSNDSTIVLRCVCGETYFAAARHVGSYVKCSCGAALLIKSVPPAVNFNNEINAQSYKRTGKSAAWKSFFSGFSKGNARVGAKIAFVLGLMLLVSYRLIYNPASIEVARSSVASPSPAASIKPLPSASPEYSYAPLKVTPPIYEESERVPVSLANGANIAPPQGPRGKMYSTIINETDSDAAVKVVESASGKTRRFVYVRANSRVTIRGIAREECRLRFATGTDWDAESRKFLSRAAYSEFETALNFRRLNYSVKLKPSILGNTPVDSIDEEKFADK